MARRLRITGVVLMGLCAALTLGLSYTWDGGGGANIRWDYCPNWDREYMLTCWPSQPTDDAFIPIIGPQTPWTVALVTTTIEDLKISGSVDFSDADPNDPNVATLETGELLIETGDEPVNITITGARIWTGP